MFLRKLSLEYYDPGFMPMRQILQTLFALVVFSLTAMGKEKIDPSNYTLTAVVSTATKGSVPTGTGAGRT
jgi:hypothetical protein